MIGADELPEAEPVGTEVVIPVPVALLVPFPKPVPGDEDPVAPAAVDVAATVVGATPDPGTLPIPFPAPPDGESPLPEEARPPPLATDEAEEATEATLDLELCAAKVEVPAAELELLEEEPALQERS